MKRSSRITTWSQLRPGLFKRQRGHGTLYVTDARVVFYAQVYPRGTQKASWIFQQTKLEDISGLSAHVSRRMSLGLVVLTLVCGLATLGTLLTLLIPLAVIFAILTVVFVIVLVRDAARRGDVGVVINSRENDNSPIAFGHGPRHADSSTRWGACSSSRSRSSSVPTARVMSSRETRPTTPTALLHELGALIIDLQTRGTMAYPEWNIAVPDGARGSGCRPVTPRETPRTRGSQVPAANTRSPSSRECSSTREPLAELLLRRSSSRRTSCSWAGSAQARPTR